MTIRLNDTATIAGTTLHSDGYLVANAFVARTGVQVYDRSELGMLGDGVLRVYRPESEVKDVASVQTYAHTPITMGHPESPVSSENWKDLAKGEVSTDAEWEDGKLRLALIVKDGPAIKAIQNGVRELSAGYTSRMDHTAGITKDGEPYDAIQRDIRINHLAIVPRGRAGIARIGDADAGKDQATWGATPIPLADQEVRLMADNKLQTVVLGDQAVQVEVADIAKIEAFKASQTQALADAASAHADAVAAKDEELGKLKADLAAAKDAAFDPAKIDQLVADRASLVNTVNAIDSAIKVEGLSDAELRKAAVVSKMGDEAVVGCSDAEIKGMFSVLSRTPSPAGDRVADGLKTREISGVADGFADVSKAFNDNLTHLQTAHMGLNGKEAN